LNVSMPPSRIPLVENVPARCPEPAAVRSPGVALQTGATVPAAIAALAIETPANHTGTPRQRSASGKASRTTPCQMPRMTPPIKNSSPSARTQAVVTVVLAVYLLGLVLSIVGNTASGSSAVVRTIKSRLFAPWMVPPWLDLGFDYRLTYGSDEEGDFRIEVRRQGDTETAALQLPGRLTGERAARWRRLARSIALEDADRDGLLSAAVGRGMFDRLHAEDVNVRVLRTPLADRGAPPASAVQASSARVRMVDGELQLLRAEPRGEVAPLVRRPGGGEATDGQSQKPAEATR
jgi:hypothetical protein